MTHLEKLLDERWPLTVDMTSFELSQAEKSRKIFSCGYNAREIEEKGNILTDREILERDYNPSWDHSDFHTIK